ncbi:Ppx/GppA family phosphatase [Alcaligenaceae bacterium]|nr:Ppx/GppA family phosphatase [Alcaligenaceae bacterium]
MDHLLAAVDLGSNSFRLSIGRVVQLDGAAQIYSIDRLKEHVRMAAGLNADNVLDEDAIHRAVGSLERFGERIQGFHPNRVRAVATNTFRIARNAPEVLPRLEDALGFPIEIISGQEEARLIFTGVTHELPPSPYRRLMIDIGGGSTEVIIGQEFRPLHMASLFMGCVSYTRRFFPDGCITEARMQQAIMAARREVETIARQYKKTGWQEAYGSSGTAKGLIAVLAETGMSQKGITREGLEQLKAKLVKDGRVDMDTLPGLKPDRAVVLAGGLAIMLAAFLELRIELMLPGDGALRMGTLYDLLGRDSKHDKRDETVKQFMRRYHIDTRQAERVKRITLELFAQLGLPGDGETAELARIIGWVAKLHEVGLSIAHADYDKHTAYVLRNADMPGFSIYDQEQLSTFALGHQGKLPKRMPEDSRNRWLALFCLRLAVLLCRRREDIPELPLTIAVNGKDIAIKASAEWLESKPLTAYSLDGERIEWKKAGFTVTLETSAP